MLEERNLKMKILHVIDRLDMGGAQALISELVPAQKELGYDVSVLQLVESRDPSLADRLKNDGVNVMICKKNGTIYNPILIMSIIKYIKSYDIIHVHLFPTLYLCGIAKLFSLSNTPLIYTEHSTYNRRRENFVLRNIDKFIYRYCYKLVVACSKKALETYREVYKGLNNNCFVSNGVNLNKIKKAEPYSKANLDSLSSESIVVIMVARFASMKRQDTVVEAIAELPSNFHAVFVGGDDGYLNKVKDIANGLGVLNRVHFLGIRNDVPRLLETSDIIVMASDYEGLSLSSIEGMASGKPFVASRVNGLKETVGGAGILFENDNSHDLANKLESLSSNEKYYKEVSNACKMRAEEYDINKCAIQYVNIYKKVLENE